MNANTCKKGHAVWDTADKGTIILIVDYTKSLNFAAQFQLPPASLKLIFFNSRHFSTYYNSKIKNFGCIGSLYFLGFEEELRRYNFF